jgi:hypothetical protein
MNTKLKPKTIKDSILDLIILEKRGLKHLEDIYTCSPEADILARIESSKTKIDILQDIVDEFLD